MYETIPIKFAIILYLILIHIGTWINNNKAYSVSLQSGKSVTIVHGIFEKRHENSESKILTQRKHKQVSRNKTSCNIVQNLSHLRSSRCRYLEMHANFIMISEICNDRLSRVVNGSARVYGKWKMGKSRGDVENKKRSSASGFYGVSPHREQGKEKERGRGKEEYSVDRYGVHKRQASGTRDVPRDFLTCKMKPSPIYNACLARHRRHFYCRPRGNVDLRFRFYLRISSPRYVKHRLSG